MALRTLQRGCAVRAGVFYGVPSLLAAVLLMALAGPSQAAITYTDL